MISASLGEAEGVHRIQRYTSGIIPPLTFGLDVVCMAVAVPIAVGLYALIIGDHVAVDLHVAAAVIAAVAFLLIRQGRGIYSSPLALLRDIDTMVVLDYAIAAMLSSAIVWQLGLVERFSRGLTLIYVGTCAAILLATRFMFAALLRRMSRSGKIGQRVALYGADPDVVDRTCRLLRLQYLPQLSLVGVANDLGAQRRSGELPYLGSLDDLVEIAARGEIDQVFISLSAVSREQLDEVLEALSSVAVDVSLIPSEAVMLAPDYRVNFLGDLPVLTLWQRPQRDADVLIKRLEDLFVAAVGLLVLLPVLLLTALAIKLTSAGPVLFVQQRFGFNNREIGVIKFRSMYVDRQDQTGAARTRRNDRRITSVGRIIRKLSIDELPQLWNVLRGDMSIVGPRPHAVHMKVGDLYYFDAVKGYRGRHRVKPGVTGLAQVRGLRGEIETIDRAKQRVEFDRHYIDNWSLMLDFRIIAETMLTVAFDKNAY